MTNRYYSLATNNEDRTADLYIFGDITDALNTGIEEAIGLDIGEVSGLSIAKDLNALTGVDQINVHINSLGGFTSEGLAILNVLKNHPAKIVTYCDGFAASAASLIFMAGDERIMGAASALMIHNAWTSADGNAAQLRQSAAVLDKVSQAAGNAYAEKVNIERSELDAMLDGENHEGTWILPDAAVEMGFATSIASEVQSSVANQSVTMDIIQRMITPRESTTAAIDTEAVAEKVYQKLAECLLQQIPPEPNHVPGKTLNSFLLALNQRGKE